jgi:hypothetical protein
VEIEGAKVLSHLDLFAQAGKNRAYDVLIPVNVTDSILNISFIPHVSNATVSAIVISH